MSEPLPFEPVPGSQADIDYLLWMKYQEQCKEEEVNPTIRDYLVWLEEQNAVTQSGE